MSVSTKDCVAKLNEVFPGNWKRKSKKGNAQTGKATVLVSRWDKDGKDLAGWEVKVVDYKYSP